MWQAVKQFYAELFFNTRLYIVWAIIIACYLFGYFFQLAYVIGNILVLALLLLLVIDLLMLFRLKETVIASRKGTQKLSNGDENLITLFISNQSNLPIQLKIIDELPIQLQVRDFEIQTILNPFEQKSLVYRIIPNERGEYAFGKILLFMMSPLRIVQRRISIAADEIKKVYPSFIQMRKYELVAISNNLIDSGIKKIRRIGHTSEFEQIKEYTLGDDVRTINWKATAKMTKLMVNRFQDERSQQVYSFIDMGRAMRMPFNGMTLVDYAINTSLVISNIALLKSDKPGVLAFNNKLNGFIKAERSGKQMFHIMETLYNLNTKFLETDFEHLAVFTKKNINQRSLILLYSNFESFSSLTRQIKYLKRIAKDHLLVVVFFENTELKKLQLDNSKTVNDIYTKVIAEKFLFEKKLINRVLVQNGIQTIYTTPEGLSINTINKYLELKARGLI
jgi:uncharacterized protein (DUF58 family)